MGENALRKELLKTRQNLDTLRDQFVHCRTQRERKRIDRLIKKQYYLSVFLGASLVVKKNTLHSL